LYNIIKIEKEADKLKKTSIGGQAVIEGVMMRGKTIYAMAVRNPEGGITLEEQNCTGLSKKYKLFTLPIFRGMAAFVDSLVTGTKIMMRSAEIAGEAIMEEEEPSKFEKWVMDKFGDKINDIIIYISVFLSIIMSVGLFFMLPVWLGGFFKTVIPTWGLGVVEGLIRISIFLIYIFAISKMKEIQRVFQYHGAEHKTINCFEKELPLTVENVRTCTRLHKRCGTSFLLIVMIISMIVLFFVQTDNIALRFVSRIVLVPFIAGISYEVIKWAGSSDNKLVAMVSYPGLCLQKITTSEPDGSQIETAIAAMKKVLEVEGDDSQKIEEIKK